jgi:membrane protease YdiL (CAAX protease family)
MTTLWNRLPVVVRAVLSGMVAASAGTIPWALLAGWNLEYLTSVPWSVPVMAAYLAVLWRYAPRTNKRANPLSDQMWAGAIVAGILGLWAVVLLQSVMSRIVRLPAQDIGDPSQVPMATLMVMLVMSAIVAGVVEETSFRGYMQAPIERRHGPMVAILVTGSIFGFAHFRHPEVTMILLPYYIAVAAVYGGLAYLTNSTLPSIVLHGIGNIFVFIQLLTTGRAEWQAAPSPQPLIWETGADASFWITVAAATAVAAAAVAAYASLAGIARGAGAAQGRSAPATGM